jgi:hypothetical protein
MEEIFISYETDKVNKTSFKNVNGHLKNTCNFMINQQTHFFNMKSLAIKLAKTLNTLYSQ